MLQNYEFSSSQSTVGVGFLCLGGLGVSGRSVEWLSSSYGRQTIVSLVADGRRTPVGRLSDGYQTTVIS